MTSRHEELIAGHLDGSLVPSEESELLEALRADPALRECLAGETEIHRHLQLRALSSEAGEDRAADRVLHYVRASEHGTRFLQSVKLRAQTGARRRVARPGTSSAPWLFAAAALLVVALAMVLMNGRPVETKPMVRRAPPAPAIEQPRAPEIVRREEPRPEAPAAVEPEVRRPEPRLEEPRKEEPAPAEKVETPALKPAPKAPETVVAKVPGIARVESVQGVASLAEGAEIAAGDGLETTGPDSSLVLRLADGTRIELGGDSALGSIAARKPGGTMLAVARGSCSADVAKQPSGSAVIFTTPHAEVRVIGTKLAIRVDLDVTRVQVTEGQVRVTALKSGQAVTLSAGQGADVAPAGAPKSHLLGLRAQYWDSNTFKGSPLLERVENAVDIVLNEKDPAPVGSDHDFGVRWEGRFLAEREGEYVFLLAVDGHEKLTLDGTILVNEKPQFFHGGRTNILRRKLTAGWHDLSIEYCDDDAKSRCTLRYVPPGLGAKDEDLQRVDSGYPVPARLFSHRK